MKVEAREPDVSSEQDAMLIDDDSSRIKSKMSEVTQTSGMVPMKGEIDDGRDDVASKEADGERDGPPSRKSTPRKNNTKRSSSNRNSNRGSSPYESASSTSSYSYSNKSTGRYPPPGRYGPPPQSYGYEHYRHPPMPHYGAMPPMHPGAQYAYPPPPSYHPYSSYPSMPYPPPPMQNGFQASESTSISSGKSKHSSKSLPRKKRTIDHYDGETDLMQSSSQPQPRAHRRQYSDASSLSDGLSLCSQSDKGKSEDNPWTRASPKRRRGIDSNPITVNTSFEDQGGVHRRNPSNASTVESAARFQKLSVTDKERETNIFLSLSTSPIHAEEMEATPQSKNKSKSSKRNKDSEISKSGIESFVSQSKSMDSAADIAKIIDRHADTPTPPLASSRQTNVLTDEHLLNRHLRGQTFTPLPQGGSGGGSPANNSTNNNNNSTSLIGTNNSFGGIQPQLSWSIAGDAPSLGDLADWEEDRNHTLQRPASTTSAASNNSRAMALSPQSFTMWKEDDPNNPHRTASRDESLRLSMLSPHSDMEIGRSNTEEGGTTTPLPFFFGEERENAHAIRGTFSNASDKSNGKDMHYNDARSGYGASYRGVPENVHSIFVNRSGSKPQRGSANKNMGRWGHPPSRNDGPSGRMRGMPPTPAYSGYDGYGRSPREMEGSYYPPYMGPPPPHHSHMPDRVRNLRGRAPPGPMSLQVPPGAMTSHHSLTSPMGMPGKVWHHASPHHHPHPPHHGHHHHHMPPPLELNPSKRKCVPLKPPIPSKFQGDIDKMKGAQVPEFTALVNFPAHMSQKQSVNLPEGMRCCVMCGSACPCSSGNKNKKPNGPGKKADLGVMDKQNGFAIIPTQNKGLCTLCDVNVWVVCQSGLEIKWCKGCKNFRPWAAFGDKGLATKCLRCRERQREKYALQKEEKEKARMLAQGKIKAEM